MPDPTTGFTITMTMTIKKFTSAVTEYFRYGGFVEGLSQPLLSTQLREQLSDCNTKDRVPGSAFFSKNKQYKKHISATV